MVISINKVVVSNIKLQTGLVYHYFGFIVLSILFFIFIVTAYVN